MCAFLHLDVLLVLYLCLFWSIPVCLLLFCLNSIIILWMPLGFLRRERERKGMDSDGRKSGKTLRGVRG